MKTAAWLKLHCNKCAPVEHRRPGVLCDPCLEICCDIAEANRRRFNKLIAAGISREMANDIMIKRGEGVPS